MLQQLKNDICGFDEIEDVLRAHFENPDIEATKVILASIAAQRIEGRPPVWVLAIAPPGSMKTAILESLDCLPSIHFVDELTDKTFISGKLDQRGKKRQTPASYLHRIGKEGVLVSADFSTVISMDRHVRNTVMAQLRRIYDGRFTREFGTEENIAERTWEGRITLIAGVTPQIDQYHAALQSLGERFIRVRWPRAGGVEVGLRALNQTSDVKRDLLLAVNSFMSPVLNSNRLEAPCIHSAISKRIAHFSEFVALARADVPRMRDGAREIFAPPQAEGNTRLAQQLAQVGRGWAVLNQRNEVGEEEFALIVRAGLDSILPIRKQILMALRKEDSSYSLGLPESSVKRTLEDLEAVGLTDKSKGNWELSEKARELLDPCFPQCVGG